MRFDLSGRAVLELAGDDEPVAAYLRGQMDPFHPGEATEGPADVVLEPLRAGRERPLLELQNAAEDDLV